jgi:putative addiction module antidote
MNKPASFNRPLKLIAIGNSTGVVLPREVLARLHVEQGGSLYVSEAADGSVRLSPYDPDFERQMQIGEDVMREDRDILRALAK